MATNKRPLKAFVRYDGSNRAVSSSLVWRKNKPKVGTWREVQGYECCDDSECSSEFIRLTLKRFSQADCVGFIDEANYKIYACDGKFTIKLEDGSLAPTGYYTDNDLFSVYVENGVVVSFAPICP